MDKSTVSIDEATKEWLKEYAYQNRTTLSEIIREYLEILKNKESK